MAQGPAADLDQLVARFLGQPESQADRRQGGEDAAVGLSRGATEEMQAVDVDSGRQVVLQRLHEGR
jgi:hypothetical protein